MKRKITALFSAFLLTFNTLPAFSAESAVPASDLSLYESSVTASDNEIGNVPVNILDGNLNTKWAAEGGGQWLQICLEEDAELEKIGIAFTNGANRVYTFRIDVSVDGDKWETVFDGKSSGKTADIEYFNLKKVKAGYIRFVGQGSNVNAWNNISELTGVTPKKIPYNLTVDGFLKVYDTTVTSNGEKYYISATDILDELKIENSYNNDSKVLTASFNGKTLNANYASGSLSGVAGCTKADITLHENGTPMISSDLVAKLTNYDVSFSESERAVKIITPEYDRIKKAYAKIDEYYLGVFDWLVSLYDPESGGFYNSVSGATYEGFYPSLEASGFVVAMLGKNESGAIEAMPEEFRQKLLNFFLSCQNPDTGFFEEPWPKAVNYNDRAKMRVLEQVTSKISQLGGKPLYLLPEERTSIGTGITDYNIEYNLALEEALSENDGISYEETAPSDENVSAPEETELEAEEVKTDVGTYSRDRVIDLPAGFPAYCASVNQFIENAASRNWSTNSWTAGDLLYEDLSYILMLDESLQQPYIDAAIEWLNENQNPETGYWADDIGFNALSGAFKVARIYERFNIEPPNSMLIAETILKTLRGGYQASAACYVRNPISTLEILCGFNADVKTMLREHECEIVEIYADYIKVMFHEDGGASSHMYMSQTTFGGLDVGLMLCEGDMDGTQQMWLARNYLCAIFGRTIDNSTLALHYDEFWNKIMNKKPIVKQKYDAAPGVVYEQNFDDKTDYYELTYENWAYQNAGSTIETKKLYGKTDKYLQINDTVESDIHTDRKTFGRIYGKFDIECSLMFDRFAPYTDRCDDMSYSVFQITSGPLAPIRLNALDRTGNTLSIGIQYDNCGTYSYKYFATVERGEWFDIKVSGEYDKTGKLKFKVYFNGKHIRSIDNHSYDNGVGFINGMTIKSSGIRKSIIGIDNVRITAY